MNPLYNIWNYNHIQQYANQQYHQNQVQQVMDAAHKLQDYLDSVDKIDREYQGTLNAICCAILMDYVKKHNIV